VTPVKNPEYPSKTVPGPFVDKTIYIIFVFQYIDNDELPGWIMAGGIRLTVTCHEGSRANERPLRFLLGEKRYEVADVIDRWYGPDYLYFKVRADDGNIYILRCDEINDEWELELFQKDGELK